MKYSIAILIVVVSMHHYAHAQNNLRYYIKQAQIISPIINENKNLAKVNQLESGRLRAFYTKPQVGITANYLLSPIVSTDNNQTKIILNPDKVKNYHGYDLSYSNGGQYQVMLNVSQPLFNGQRYKTASDLLNVFSQINQNNAKINAHDIVKIVTDQYILCLQDNKQIIYAEAMVSLLADQKFILQKLVENSIYKKSDLTLLIIEQQNFLAQLTTFKASYRRDLMDLNILCGISDTVVVELQPGKLVINSTVSNSKFLEKYRLDSLNLVSQQKIFELKYKPQINLFANTGLNAVYAPTIPNRFGISAGVSFIYNLWDGNQKNISRNKTTIKEQSVLFYIENFNTQNTIRKTKIITELQSYTERISIAERQLQEYKLLLNSYKKEMVSGQLSIINYLTVLKNAAIAQRDYTLLFTNQQSLINAYNYWNW